MPGRQAKTLSAADVNDLLVFASCTRNPLRNRVIVLLSAKAGLRANEIANLTWDMVLGPTGQISGMLELRDHAAKKGSGRIIPIHPELRPALADLRQVAALSEHVVTSGRGGPMTSLSIVVGCSDIAEGARPFVPSVRPRLFVPNRRLARCSCGQSPVDPARTIQCDPDTQRLDANRTAAIDLRPGDLPVCCWPVRG